MPDLLSDCNFFMTRQGEEGECNIRGANVTDVDFNMICSLLFVWWIRIPVGGSSGPGYLIISGFGV